MDEETVIVEAAEPMCPVCGSQIDLVETEDEDDEWRCAEDHWSKAKRLVKFE